MAALLAAPEPEVLEAEEAHLADAREQLLVRVERHPELPRDLVLRRRPAERALEAMRDLPRSASWLRMLEVARTVPPVVETLVAEAEATALGEAFASAAVLRLALERRWSPRPLRHRCHPTFAATPPDDAPNEDKALLRLVGRMARCFYQGLSTEREIRHLWDALESIRSWEASADSDDREVMRLASTTLQDGSDENLFALYRVWEAAAGSWLSRPDAWADISKMAWALAGAPPPD